MKDKKHLVSLLAALAASVIFGFSFMFSKIGLEVASSSVMLAFRFTAAFLAMTLAVAVNALVAKVRGRALFPFSLRGKPVGLLVLLGMVQPVCYFACENYGIIYTSSCVAGTIIAVVPVMCILVDVLVMHQRVTRRQVICAVCCVAGVALIGFGGETRISPLGLLFLILTMLCDTLYYVFSHRAAQKCNAFEVTYIMFTVGMVVFIPVALIHGTGHMAQTFLPAIQSGAFWSAVLYLGVVSSIGGYMLLNFANGALHVSESSLFANVTTVVSLLAGVLLLKEPFGAAQLAGVVIILVCVYAANVAAEK